MIIGERTAGLWTPEVALRLYILIIGPLTALACSFVPIIISEVTQDYGTVWRISNAVLGMAHLANMIPFLLADPQSAGKTLGQWINLGIGLTFVTAHFLAALDVLPWYSAIFIAGLLQQTWIGLHNFLLLFRPHLKDQ